MRPLWRCDMGCGDWPCQPAKDRLLAEYTNDRTALLMYLGAQMTEAEAQLNQIGAPASLYDRFIRWARSAD